MDESEKALYHLLSIYTLGPPATEESNSRSVLAILREDVESRDRSHHHDRSQ